MQLRSAHKAGIGMEVKGGSESGASWGVSQDTLKLSGSKIPGSQEGGKTSLCLKFKPRSAVCMETECQSQNEKLGEGWGDRRDIIASVVRVL